MATERRTADPDVRVFGRRSGRPGYHARRSSLRLQGGRIPLQSQSRLEPAAPLSRFDTPSGRPRRINEKFMIIIDARYAGAARRAAPLGLISFFASRPKP